MRGRGHSFSVVWCLRQKYAEDILKLNEFIHGEKKNINNNICNKGQWERIENIRAEATKLWRKQTTKHLKQNKHKNGPTYQLGKQQPLGNRTLKLTYADL